MGNEVMLGRPLGGPLGGALGLRPATPPAQPPILATVSPASGPLAGGTTITLSGSNLTGATSVTIGGVAATSVNVVNASTVTCVTPAGGAGAKDVVITTLANITGLIGGFTHEGAFSSSVTFVSGGNGAFAGSTFVFTPSGLAAGDWMFVVADGVVATSVTGGSGATWTITRQFNAAGTWTTLFYRQLSAGDVGATFTINGGSNTGPAEWVAYRGVASVVAPQLKVSAADAATLVFDGPVVSGSSSRFLAILSEHGSGSGNWTAPANWTARVAWSQYGPKWLGDIQSSLLPAGSITFSTSVTHAGGQVGWLFELIGT